MKPQHKLGMIAMMSAMMSAGLNETHGGNQPRCERPAPEMWKRKKCKSCKLFQSTECYERYAKPTDSACSKYTKRK